MRKHSQITKAVIAVAGSGTRFLPATKSLPKEMLPIFDRPIVHYVVEEMVEAGIKDIILVTRDDKKPLEDYFDHNVLLEQELQKKGEQDLLEEVQRVAEMANFVYVRQKGAYGNGTPVLCVKNLVRDEPFVFAYGDDLIKSMENYARNQAVVMGCQEVKPEEVSLYGIMKKWTYSSYI